MQNDIVILRLRRDGDWPVAPTTGVWQVEIAIVAGW
jgi:hypothetical protein